MDTRQRLRQEIDRAEVALVARVRALEHRVEAIKERVFRAFDLDYQVQARPWGAVGTAVAVGFVIGRWTA